MIFNGQINQYQVEKELGSGSQGTVYYVSKIQQNKTKILSGGYALGEQVGITNDEQSFYDLLIKKQQDSPMLKIHEYYEYEEGKYHIVQQFCSKGSLEKNLNCLNIQEVNKVIKEIGNQLEFIHKNGYVYQDLKPENIVIGSNNLRIPNHYYKICDFGSVEKIKNETVVLSPRQRPGSHWYQPKDRITDFSIDIFAFGSLIYELVSKQKLFDGEKYNKEREKFYTNQTEIYQKIDILKGITQIQKQLLKSMLNPDQQKRPKIELVNRIFNQQSDQSIIQDYGELQRDYQINYQKLQQQKNGEQKFIKSQYSTKDTWYQPDQEEQELISLNNNQFLCNIELSEKIEILNQKLFRELKKNVKLDVSQKEINLLEYLISQIIKDRQQNAKIIENLNQNIQNLIRQKLKAQIKLQKLDQENQKISKFQSIPMKLGQIL